MSSTISQARVYLQHRGLVFWSFFLPVFMLIPLTVWAHLQDKGAVGASLATLTVLTMSTAFFLASAQQELLNKAFCFLMPGVRVTMVRDQVLVGIAVAVLTLLAAFMVPGLVAVVQGSVALGWSLMSLMVLVYVLTILVEFHFAYAAWLPFQVIWIASLAMKPLLRVSPDSIRVVLAQTSLLTFVAGLMVFVLWQQMRSRGMRRKLTERPYISIADLRHPAKVEAYKRAINLHKAPQSEKVRPLAGLMRRLTRRIAEARNAGNRARALVLEAMLLSLANSVPRTRLKSALLFSIFPVGLTVFGYLDSRAVSKGDGDLLGWFTGLIFMGLVVAMGLMAYHLRVRTMGRLVNRRDMLHAGWLGTGVMLGLGLALSLLLFGAGHFLAAVLPEIVINDRTYFMVGPRVYLLAAPYFILPAQLLVFTLWRKPGSQMVLQQTGTMAFFAYHAALNMIGVEFAWIPVTAVTVAMWLALPWVWHWRVLRKDQV